MWLPFFKLHNSKKNHTFFPGMFYEQLLMNDLKYNGFPVVITTRHPLTVDNIDNMVDCYSFKGSSIN